MFLDSSHDKTSYVYILTDVLLSYRIAFFFNFRYVISLSKSIRNALYSLHTIYFVINPKSPRQRQYNKG